MKNGCTNIFYVAELTWITLSSWIPVSAHRVNWNSYGLKLPGMRNFLSTENPGIGPGGFVAIVPIPEPCSRCSEERSEADEYFWSPPLRFWRLDGVRVAPERTLPSA